MDIAREIKLCYRKQQFGNWKDIPREDFVKLFYLAMGLAREECCIKLKSKLNQGG